MTNGHVAVSDGYVGRVKGTRGTFPRGYPWVMLVWYAVAGVVFATVAVHSWFGPAGGIVIVAAGAWAVWTFWNGKAAVFRVSPAGIRLGGARHTVTLPWDEIQEIRISPAADGAVADILPLPSAPLAPRGLSPAAELLLAFVPASYLFLRPPLLTPLTDPTRYSVALWGTTVDEVAAGLRPLVPDSVPITR